MKYLSNIRHFLSRFKALQYFFKGKGMIIMLHRIAPFEERLAPNENMKVTPEFLESFIIQARDSHYHFISLDELYNGLVHNDLPEYFICFTIDDGYRDNLTFGYPIFAKYNIPFCIYICTSFPESSHNMWWFGLEDHLLGRDRILYNNTEHDISSPALKESMFLQIRSDIITRVDSYEACREVLDSLGISYNPRAYDHLALSWQDIAFLHSQRTQTGQNLCTIGCHTHSHPIFNNLTLEQIAKDIQKSQALFTHNLLFTPTHFAYPFGSRAEVSAHHFSLIQNLGFKTAATTRQGTIYPQHARHLHALPRIFFHQHFALESAFSIRQKRIVTA